jgi:hypothetical protein
MRFSNSDPNSESDLWAGDLENSEQTTLHFSAAISTKAVARLAADRDILSIKWHEISLLIPSGSSDRHG